MFAPDLSCKKYVPLAAPPESIPTPPIVEVTKLTVDEFLA
jgi:hypothetical protein